MREYDRGYLEGWNEAMRQRLYARGYQDGVAAARQIQQEGAQIYQNAWNQTQHLLDLSADRAAQEARQGFR